MRSTGIAAFASVLVLAVAGSATGSVAPAATARHCAADSTSATIAGKHACLKKGARCTKRLDGAYHRYRYHCHSGRLTRFPAAPPPVGTPPTLPEPPASAGALVDVGGYRLHLECVGTAAPTVVIETGQNATRLNYRKVQYALAGGRRFEPG